MPKKSLQNTGKIIVPSGQRLREIRQSLAPTGEVRDPEKDFTIIPKALFAALLGYAGTPRSLANNISSRELEYLPITLATMRLAEMYARHGIPKEWVEDLHGLDWDETRRRRAKARAAREGEI